MLIWTDWPQEDAEVPGEQNTHLWEESWDDDDTSEDFSKQLKYGVSKLIDGKFQALSADLYNREELEKVKANK